MNVSQKHKIWGSRILGVFAFAFSLVLTPRVWVDSSASTAPELVPIQSIQPFQSTMPPIPCSDCTPSLTITDESCLSDQSSEHSTINLPSDQTTPQHFARCKNSVISN